MREQQRGTASSIFEIVIEFGSYSPQPLSGSESVSVTRLVDFVLSSVFMCLLFVVDVFC